MERGDLIKKSREKRQEEMLTAEDKANGILSHDVLIALFLSLFTLSLVGIGNVLIIGIIGLLLCMLGLMQKSAKVDLWVLVPLMLYLLIGIVSSYRAYKGAVQGYEAKQIIYPVVYLLLGCIQEKEQLRLKRMCVLWTEIIAVTGVCRFVFQAFTHDTARLGWLLGNPNALGIFLVLGWLALVGLRSQEQEGRGGALLYHLEPFLLIAVALTLSMEGFLSMAVGLLALLVDKKRSSSASETFFYACRMLAKPVLGIGVGLLLYLAADIADAPWVCFLLLAYAFAVSLCWRKFEAYLEEYPKMAVMISAAGFLVTAAAIAMRPNAIATFLERLEMMRNGLGYIREHPLLGVGSYRWRVLNLYDSDKYFNTWLIHNSFIHAGAELGIIAAAMLVVITVRFYKRRKEPVTIAVFTAFLLHNLMDTSFFYIGITVLVMLLAGTSKNNTRMIGGAAMKIIFGAFAIFFLFSLYLFKQMA